MKRARTVSGAAIARAGLYAERPRSNANSHDFAARVLESRTDLPSVVAEIMLVFSGSGFRTEWSPAPFRYFPFGSEYGIGTVRLLDDGEFCLLCFQPISLRIERKGRERLSPGPVAY